MGLTRMGRRQGNGDQPRSDIGAGPYVQVSRLGNPLFNEVIVPMAEKDYWNSQPPAFDKQFRLPGGQSGIGDAPAGPLSGGVPQFDAFNKTGAARADLLAILLTGIPSGIVAGFQKQHRYDPGRRAPPQCGH